MQAVCNICFDLFDSRNDVAATPCGHTFHRVCLDEWTKIQKTCPQCRLKFTVKNVIPKLYFETADGNADEIDTADLQNKIQSLQTTLLTKDKEKNEIIKHKQNLESQVVVLEIQRSQLENTLHASQTERAVLQSQLQFLDQQITETQKAKAETKLLRAKLTEYQNLETILQGSDREASEVLRSYGGKTSVNQPLIGYCSVLKKRLQRTTEQKKQLKQEVDERSREVSDLQRRLRLQEVSNADLQADLKHSEELQEGLKIKVAALQALIDSPTERPAKSALSRLISESPASHLTTTTSSDDSRYEAFSLTPSAGFMSSPDIRTPRVMPKLKTHESKSHDNFNTPRVMPRLKPHRSKSQDDFKMFMAPFVKQKKLPSNSAAPLEGKHSNIPVATNLAANRGTGYNGLGGHSKADVFPKLGSAGITKLKRPVNSTLKLQSRQNVPNQQPNIIDLVSPLRLR